MKKLCIITLFILFHYSIIPSEEPNISEFEYSDESLSSNPLLQKYRDFLREAIFKKNIKNIKKCLPYAGVSTAREPFLYDAVMSNDPNIVKLLIEAGASLNFI